MTGEGIVIAADEAFVTVAVRQQTACDGCHAKDGCASCASMLEVHAHNDCGAEVGDRVEIASSTGRVLLYALLVFVFPLIPAAAAYFALYHALNNTLLAAGGALAALLAFFLFLRLTVDKKAAKRCDRSARKIIEKRSPEKGPADDE